MNMITGHMDAGIVVAAVHNPAHKRDGSFLQRLHMREPRASGGAGSGGPGRSAIR